MICTYVLAAGKSERFGKEKLLQKINGKTLLEISLNLASLFGDPTVVVKPSLEVPEGFRAVVNENYKEGISTSVKLALKDARNRNCDMLIFLADMPLLKKETVLRILDVSERSDKWIIYPTYLGRKGFPTLIRRKAFNFLDDLSGDEGFKKVIREHPEICESVPVNDPGCVFDIDTPEDLKRAAKVFGRS